MAWNGIKIVFVFVHLRLHIKKNIMTFFCYPGITGCPLQAYIFMGPIYYQKLKHMVRPCAYFIMYQNSILLMKSPFSPLPSSLLPERDYLSAWGFSFDLPLMQQVHDLRFQHMLVCHFFFTFKTELDKSSSRSSPPNTPQHPKRESITCPFGNLTWESLYMGSICSSF